MIIILVIFIAVSIYLFFRNLKILNVNAVYCIDGAVKGGKSLLSVNLAIKKYKLNVLKWRINNIFNMCLYMFNNHIDFKAKPVLYSNIPLFKIEHSPLIKDILLRNVLIPNKSVVLIDEASLVADSMTYTDKLLNEKIMLFIKLFGHYSKGGTLILNTQSISDLHYNLKRCISKYTYIYKRMKFPFFSVLKVRELINCEDNNGTMNIFSSDIEDSFKNVIISNRYYKTYDCFCYSIFTDNKIMYQNNISLSDPRDLKTKSIVSFKKWYSEDIKGGESHQY